MTTQKGTEADQAARQDNSAPQSGSPAPSGRQKQEQALDKSVEDTFPASDPPAQSEPGTSVGWSAPEDEGDAKKK
jgi:hypothetical protein